MRKRSHSFKNSAALLLLTAFLFSISSIKISAQDTNLDSLFKAGLQHHKKGMDLVAMGEKKAGLKELDLATSDFKDHIYELQKQADSLKLVYSGLLGEYPKSPVLHYVIGMCEFLKNRDASSVPGIKAWFDKALDIEPDYIGAYNGYVSLAYLKQDEDEVMRLYKKVLEIDPDKLSVCWSYAGLLSKRGKTDEANALRNHAIKTDSSSDYSIRCLMDMAKEKKTVQEKQLLFEKAVRLVKDKWELQSVIAATLRTYTADSPELAELFANRILKNEIGNKDRYNRMRALESLSTVYSRKFKDKIIAFTEIAMKDDNPRVLSELGAYYSDSLKNNEAAIRCYLKAYEIASAATVENVFAFGSGKSSSEFFNNSAKRFKYGSMSVILGKIYYEMKDYSNAEKYLRESIETNEKQKSNYPHLYLAYTLAETGRKEEAVKWLAKGISMKSSPEGEKRLKQLTEELKLTKTTDDIIREERIKNAKPAVDFILKDLEGNDIQLSKLNGKVVMLDFWGTWCGPCVQELPHLVKLYEKYKDNPDVVFFGIDINEKPPVIKKFMEEKKYSFNVLIGESASVQKDYDVTAVPTKFLIDRQGRVQYSHIGYSPKEDVVEALSKEIDELLKLK